MSDLKDDGADHASIKPVSSLRSLFEKQAPSDTQNQAPSKPPPPKSPLRFNHAQNGNQTPTRASLDIPRIPSPWSTSELEVVPQHKNSECPPLPNPRRTNSSTLQRPLSTNSISASRSAPFVTVNAPISPPKSPRAPNIHRAYRSSIASPVTPSKETIEVPHLHSSPTEDPDRGSAGGLQPSVPDRKMTVPGGRPTHENISGPSAQRFTSSDHFPFNRIEKPKVPSKPSSMTAKANLEPSVSASSDRVSPFSTPPSSDESIDAENQGSRKYVEAKHRREGTRSLRDSKAYQPRDLNTLQAVPCNDEEPVHSRYKKLDARATGHAQAIDAKSPSTETPPGLPPRKNHTQQYAHVNEEKLVNQGQMVSAVLPLSDRSRTLQVNSIPKPEFLPPPRRTPNLGSRGPPKAMDNALFYAVSQVPEATIPLRQSYMNEQDPDLGSYTSPVADYPDVSNTNRRPPFIKQGVTEIDTSYDSRLVDICGQYVVAAGHITRVWNVSSGELVANLGHAEKETRVTALAFKPALTADHEGCSLWLGTNIGDMQELSIPSQSIVCSRVGAHERREIVRIHRYQNSMWTLDESGKLCVWQGDSTGLPDLKSSPRLHRVSKGYTFSLVIHSNLWLATGKDIRIFRPNCADHVAFSILQEPLSQPNVGAVTSGATVSSQLDRVYFGHVDGKVTIYSTTDFTCLGIVNVSNYRISCLVGVGTHLWAGYSTGMLTVYDCRAKLWVTKKNWLGHTNPILNILVDRSSLWKEGHLRVLSHGTDNILKFWDGTLQTDWMENDMHDRDIEFCSFRELTALVLSWNAGAATPTHLRHDERDFQFFQSILLADTPPDLLVFGFQELVDLEDKKLTAKTLFKGNKKKDPSEQEHMSRQYRAWRDYLVRCIEDSMPSNEPYHLLHTASMVGLFSCVFIKASQRSQVRNLNAVEIKRGMGGLHGNKGALILRFILDDTSICLINCHLAAGQTQTISRNNDISAILEATMLLPSHHTSAVSDTFAGGGDGSMILDHEICILHGDLNYRIDTMGRDTVIKAISTDNLPKLLERDQLLVSRRRNAGFRLRAFTEFPITFAPTYKYDVGSDRYDTSEKRRAPAWCDRILHRGAGKLKQVDYRRHELRVSDHRPVSGQFRIRVKAINPDSRANTWKTAESHFAKARESLAQEAKVQYLRDVLGVPPSEARRLL